MITRLSDIIDSGSQAELLAFLITATPRSFSVLELTRRLNINSNALQAAAASLEKQNLLKTFTKHGVRFYLLNYKNALIPQLKPSLDKEHQPWPDELVSSLKKLGSFSGIFLSGLFVGRSESMVDILLVGNVNTIKLNQFLKTNSKQFGGDLNYCIMSLAEFKMRRDTFDRFIKDIFDYPHIVLVDKSNLPEDNKISDKPIAPKPLMVNKQNNKILDKHKVKKVREVKFADKVKTTSKNKIEKTKQSNQVKSARVKPVSVKKQLPPVSHSKKSVKKKIVNPTIEASKKVVKNSKPSNLRKSINSPESSKKKIVKSIYTQKPLKKPIKKVVEKVTVTKKPIKKVSVKAARKPVKKVSKKVVNKNFKKKK